MFVFKTAPNAGMETAGYKKPSRRDEYFLETNKTLTENHERSACWQLLS